MSFNKKYLLLIPVVLITILTVKFLKDRFSPMRFSGTVEATQVVVSARLSSNISSISVHEGDQIQKDSDLLKLDCEDVFEALKRLSQDYERAKNLLKSGAGSKESLDQTKSRYEEAQIKESWCTIKSPLDGIVINKFHEVGEYVNSGTKLFTILDKKDFWVYFYIPQTLINRFKVGEDVSTILPETKEIITGKIIKINETAEFTPKNVQTYDERARLVYGIKVKVENKDGHLKPGMTLDFEIEK